MYDITTHFFAGVCVLAKIFFDQGVDQALI